MNFNFQEGHNGEKVARARQCSVVALYMIVALTGWQGKLPKPPYLWAKEKCVDLNDCSSRFLREQVVASADGGTSRSFQVANAERSALAGLELRQNNVAVIRDQHCASRDGCDGPLK